MAHDEDRLLDSLRVLEHALRANARRSDAMRTRIAEIREQRRAGRPCSEIVASEKRPLVVELVTESVRELDSAGVQVRRHEARALYPRA